MVVVQGLMSRPELNGRHAFVVGSPTDSGMVSVCLAPLMPTEPLIAICVEPENISVAPQTPHAMAAGWNNLAFAYKRAGRNEEAAGAYETALELGPPGEAARQLVNLIKLCMAMIIEDRAAPRPTDRPPDYAAKLNEKMQTNMARLFEPVRTNPNPNLT